MEEELEIPRVFLDGIEVQPCAQAYDEASRILICEWHHKNRPPIKKLCELFNISDATFYTWRRDYFPERAVTQIERPRSKARLSDIYPELEVHRPLQVGDILAPSFRPGKYLLAYLGGNQAVFVNAKTGMQYGNIAHIRNHESITREEVTSMLNGDNLKNWYRV